MVAERAPFREYLPYRLDKAPSPIGLAVHADTATYQCLTVGLLADMKAVVSTAQGAWTFPFPALSPKV